MVCMIIMTQIFWYCLTFCFSYRTLAGATHIALADCPNPHMHWVTLFIRNKIRQISPLSTFSQFP